VKYIELPTKTTTTMMMMMTKKTQQRDPPKQHMPRQKPPRSLGKLKQYTDLDYREEDVHYHQKQLQQQFLAVPFPEANKLNETFETAATETETDDDTVSLVRPGVVSRNNKPRYADKARCMQRYIHQRQFAGVQRKSSGSYKDEEVVPAEIIEDDDDEEADSCISSCASDSDDETSKAESDFMELLGEEAEAYYMALGSETSASYNMNDLFAPANTNSEARTAPSPVPSQHSRYSKNTIEKYMPKSSKSSSKIIDKSRTKASSETANKVVNETAPFQSVKETAEDEAAIFCLGTVSDQSPPFGMAKVAVGAGAGSGGGGELESPPHLRRLSRDHIVAGANKQPGQERSIPAPTKGMYSRSDPDLPVFASSSVQFDESKPSDVVNPFKESTTDHPVCGDICECVEPYEMRQRGLKFEEGRKKDLPPSPRGVMEEAAAAALPEQKPSPVSSVDISQLTDPLTNTEPPQASSAIEWVTKNMNPRKWVVSKSVMYRPKKKSLKPPTTVTISTSSQVKKISKEQEKPDSNISFLSRIPGVSDLIKSPAPAPTTAEEELPSPITKNEKRNNMNSEAKANEDHQKDGSFDHVFSRVADYVRNVMPSKSNGISCFCSASEVLPTRTFFEELKGD
jgi:hypothetical protein